MKSKVRFGLKLKYLKQVTLFALLTQTVLALFLWQSEPVIAVPQTINHQCPDSLELNDTADSATALIPGQTRILTLDSGGVVGTHDKDWFDFTVVSGQQLTVTVTMPGISVLTATELSLYTSADNAANGISQVITTGQKLHWLASDNITTQTLWILVRNPYAASQTSFCDAFYYIDLSVSGSLNNDLTQKTALADYSRAVTYTISLNNQGGILGNVRVIDHLPPNIILSRARVYPASANIIVQTTTTALTWTGRVPQATQVDIVLSTFATAQAESLQNTAYIEAGGVVFSRTNTSVEIVPFKHRLFLPLLLK